MCSKVCEWQEPKWNGVVTGSRNKEGGGFCVLGPQPGAKESGEKTWRGMGKLVGTGMSARIKRKAIPTSDVMWFRWSGSEENTETNPKMAEIIILCFPLGVIRTEYIRGSVNVRCFENNSRDQTEMDRCRRGLVISWRILILELSGRRTRGRPDVKTRISSVLVVVQDWRWDALREDSAVRWFTMVTW